MQAKTTQESLSHVVDRAGLRHYFRLNHLQLYNYIIDLQSETINN